MQQQIYSIEKNEEGHIGCAIILNNRNFKHQTPPRAGSEKDVENIRKSLVKLDFKVYEPLLDLTAKEVRSDLDKLVESIDFENYSCSICIVMSYCDLNGRILGTDGKSVDLNDFIIDAFDDCEQLNGKPKLFFVQACRGSESRAPPLIELHEIKQFDFANTLNTKFENTDRSSLPKDVLVFYSTSENYVSLYRDLLGSVFFLALCQVLDKYAQSSKRIEIEDLLKTVNLLVTEIYKIQQPGFSSSLSKLLYFKWQDEVEPKTESEIAFGKIVVTEQIVIPEKPIVDLAYDINVNINGHIGCALMTNNYPKGSLLERIGFSKYEDWFKQCLENNNLNVFLYAKPKQQEIRTCVDTIDFSRFSCFLCVCNCLLAENTAKYFSYMGDIIMPFLNLPHLKDKPKLFFLDICVKDELNNKTRIDLTDISQVELELNQRLRFEDHVLVCYSVEKVTEYRTRKHNVPNPSRFIQELGLMFNSSLSSDREFADLLEQTFRRKADDQRNIFICNRLSKKLYLGAEKAIEKSVENTRRRFSRAAVIDRVANLYKQVHFRKK